MSIFLHRAGLIRPLSQEFEATFVTSTSQSSVTVNRTFTAVNIGSPHSTRRVIVTIGTFYDGPGSVTSVTIGGVAATIHVQQQDAEGDSAVAIASALVPTGSTADIVIDSSATNFGMVVGVYRLINEASATPTDTASAAPSGTFTLNATIDVADGGCVIAVSAWDASPVIDAAWTGVTEDFFQTLLFGGYSGASQMGLAAQSNRPIQVVWSGDEGFDAALAVISWR